MIGKCHDGSRAAQFELERVLRNKILCSSKEDCAAAIDAAYRELFEKFPGHSRLAGTLAAMEVGARLGARLILPLSKRGSTILEVGCGRGAVLMMLAREGRICTGVEPSRDMLEWCQRNNVNAVPGVADRLDFPDDSFDLVFSQEMLEHLPPKHVPCHFAEAFRVLRPNGILSVETPNRRTGPHDVSRGFTRVAQGLHLKEWTVREVIRLFREAGFVEIRGLLAPQFLARRWEWIHRVTRTPAIVKYLEDLLLWFVPPLFLRTMVGKAVGLDDIFLFARKPEHA